MPIDEKALQCALSETKKNVYASADMAFRAFLQRYKTLEHIEAAKTDQPIAIDLDSGTMFTPSGVYTGKISEQPKTSIKSALCPTCGMDIELYNHPQPCPKLSIWSDHQPDGHTKNAIHMAKLIQEAWHKKEPIPTGASTYLASHFLLMMENSAVRQISCKHPEDCDYPDCGVRPRPSERESANDWVRKPIDTIAINDGMHFEVNNMVPIGEVWFTDKNDRVIGKITNIGMVSDIEDREGK